ncbi:MAG: SDR family oxidoreductase, partial [Deltaproteobacteria bacterium]|nr:SDR family oxidoreductase [Deltaproteobacteria bacterium]
KLANVLFAAELARRLEGTGVTTYSLHPGVVASDVWRRVPWPFRSLMKLGMITNEEGAQTTLHCATAPALASESGLYYDRSAPKRSSRLARDENLQRLLWERSEEVSGCRWPG